MRRLAFVLALALAGCSAFQPGSPDALSRAQVIGSEAGKNACLAAVVKRPQSKPALASAMAEATLVLTSPDPTLAGVQKAIDRIPNDDDKLLVQAGLSSTIIVLAAAGVDVPKLDISSPVFVGVASFVAACNLVVTS